MVVHDLQGPTISVKIGLELTLIDLEVINKICNDFQINVKPSGDQINSRSIRSKGKYSSFQLCYVQDDLKLQMNILEADCLMKIFDLKRRLLTFISEEIIVVEEESLCNFQSDFTDEGDVQQINLNKNPAHSSKTLQDKK